MEWTYVEDAPPPINQESLLAYDYSGGKGGARLLETGTAPEKTRFVRTTYLGGDNWASLRQWVYAWAPVPQPPTPRRS